MQIFDYLEYRVDLVVVHDDGGVVAVVEPGITDGSFDAGLVDELAEYYDLPDVHYVNHHL